MLFSVVSCSSNELDVAELNTGSEGGVFIHTVYNRFNRRQWVYIYFFSFNFLLGLLLLLLLLLYIAYLLREDAF